MILQSTCFFYSLRLYYRDNKSHNTKLKFSQTGNLCNLKKDTTSPINIHSEAARTFFEDSCMRKTERLCRFTRCNFSRVSATIAGCFRARYFLVSCVFPVTLDARRYGLSASMSTRALLPHGVNHAWRLEQDGAARLTASGIYVGQGRERRRVWGIVILLADIRGARGNQLVSRDAIFFAALLRRHCHGEETGGRYGRTSVKPTPKDVQWADAKKKERTTKESRVLVNTTETFSAATFRSHLESVNGEEGRMTAGEQHWYSCLKIERRTENCWLNRDY